ncbi:branched-chain amino acid ABC transporter permease [Halobellus ruber]|uniref:Branched-chain amino acid ABC transporter permease n=1 Tax=Halobellus ruber TaxID=2761102 RepID=A0A7J9SH30_9EURY|nr:branched-chain amino acid ABC transporter permease [Halobellus ruber]MBB6645306.1 branched-chain amino acid ABC transporter permease [Halobellus ruber]
MVALGAIGLSMVYSIAEVPNFAHGDLLTLGAYMALLINKPGNVPLLDVLTTGGQSPTTGGLVVLFALGILSTLGTIYMLGGVDALLGSFWPIDVPRPAALVVHVGLGAVVGAIAALGLPSIIAGMLFSGVVVAALGPLQERYVFGKFRAKDISLAMMLVVSLAMSFVLRFTVQAIFGSTTRSYSLQPELELFGSSVNMVVVKFFDLYFTGGGFLMRISDPVSEAVLFNGFYSWVSFLLMLVAAVAVGYAGYRFRRGTRAILGPYLLGSIVGLIAFAAVGIVAGTPASVPRSPIYGTRVKLSVLNAFIIVLALAMMGLLHTLLRATKLGKAMRATSDNRDLAEIRGIDVGQVTMGVWVLAGLYAGIGGATLGVLFGTLKITMGFFILLPMFAAVIVGGITIYGALVGSYIVGLAMEIGIFALPLGATYRTPMAFVVLILVLLIKPEGITG